MSSITSPTPCVSRPKIHRLPKAGAYRRFKKLEQAKILVPLLIIILAAAVPVICSKQFSASHDKKMINAGMLPQISVGPKDGLVEEQSLIGHATDALSGTIGDAQAATTGAMQLDQNNKIISLHDNSESIVGQMAKIPVENEQITEIKAVNDIDNHAGRELLSIISKY